MKVQPKSFKGIEYIQVSQLPPEQYEKFQQTINKSLYIKILIDGKVISGCIQYKDYSLWFDNIYTKSKTIAAPVPASAVSVDKA